MSLKYRNASGVETPVAGLNGTSGELVPSVALKQTNTITISSGTTIGTVGLYFDVYLATPMPDTDYNVLLQIDTMYPEDTIAFSVGEAEKHTNRYRLYPICDTVKTLEHDIILIGTAVKFMTDESRALDEAHIAQNTANFAPAFSEVTSYAVGDYVTYNNILYRCTTAHTAGVWVAGHFTQVTVGGEVKKQNGVESNVDFNTLTTPGVYSSAGANSPESGYWYTVTVQSGYINGQRYILQFASSTVDTAGTWRRVYTGSTWSAWQKLALESESSQRKNYWSWTGSNTFTINLEDVALGIGNRYTAMLSVFSTSSDNADPATHIFSIGVLMTAPHPITIVSVGGNSGFSATASGYDVTITCPSDYCNAKLIY